MRKKLKSHCIHPLRIVIITEGVLGWDVFSAQFALLPWQLPVSGEGIQRRSKRRIEKSARKALWRLTLCQTLICCNCFLLQIFWIRITRPMNRIVPVNMFYWIIFIIIISSRLFIELHINYNPVVISRFISLNDYFGYELARYNKPELVLNVFIVCYGYS